MKKILSILLMVLILISSTFVNVFAAIGTEQRLKFVEKDDGIPMFTATEEGEEFYVYCFNSDLAWPERPETDSGYTTQTYVPDDLLELDNYHITVGGSPRSVKDMIHRIFYAGFPHNNAGLYVEDNDHNPTLEEMTRGLDFQPEIITFFPELDNGVYTFLADGTGTLNNINTPEAQTIVDIANTIIGWSLFGTAEEKVKLTKILTKYTDFYSFVYAYSNVVEFDLDFDQYLAYFYKMALTASGIAVSSDEAHSATQIAIWIILKRAGVPRNTKNFEDYYNDEQSLVRRLVDFAYGDDPIPERNYDQNILNTYKTNFNNGEYLLNANNESIKSHGGIKFTYNPKDGKYYSEILKFERKTTESLIEKAYLSKFDIEILDANNNVISETIQYGKEDFVLVCDEKPVSTKVSVKSDNYWPTPIYQYRAKSDVGKSYSEQVYQEMSGVRYEKVELGFSMLALDENADLTIKKTVNNKGAAQGTHFWFDANIKILDSYGQQTSGWLNYTKYKLDASGNIKDDTGVEGTVYNYGATTTANPYNTRFSLQADEAIVIHDLPYGTTYNIVEYGLSESGDSLGNWTPEYAGNTSNITSGTNLVKVNNKYKFSPVNLQINGDKILMDGANYKNFEAGDFSFIMWPDVHGYPMPAGSEYNTETLRYQKVVSNTAPTDTTTPKGTFDFGSIEFDRAGEYSYTIEEQQVTKPNISKDPTHYHVKVKVEENGATFKKTVTIERHNADHTSASGYTTPTPADLATATLSFKNTYSNIEVDKEIRIKKAISNESSDKNISRAGYVFNVVPVDDSEKYPYFNAGTANATRSIEITTGESGEAVTPILQLKKDWFNTYQQNNEVRLKYKITEKTGNVSGITYSTETAYATIVVTRTIDASSEELYSVEILYDYGTHTNSLTPAVFTNRYNASSDFNINIQKNIVFNLGLGTYKPATGESYKFVINDDFERNGNKSGYTLPTDKTVNLTYDGTNFVASNNVIKFNHDGDYRFELSEVIGDVNGITYDTDKWILDINVTDNGNGTFSFTSEYYKEHTALEKKDKAEFNNHYTATANLDLKLSKVLVGRDLTNDDTFTFSVYHAEGSISNPCDISNATHEHKNLQHPTKIVLDSSNSFNLNLQHAIKIHNAGKYYVSVIEDVPVGAKMEYDESVYILEVDIVQDGNILKVNDGSPKYYKAPNAQGWGSKVTATQNFEFINKTTNLSIQKKAESCEPNVRFTFEITLIGADNNPLSNQNIHSTINGSSHNIATDINGKATFVLKENQTLSIPDLPKGTKYKIVEANTPVTTTKITRKENGVEKSSLDGKTVEDLLELGVNELIVVTNKGNYTPGNNPPYQAPPTSVKIIYIKKSETEDYI